MLIDHQFPSRNARKAFQINKKRPSQPFGIKMGRPTKHRRFKFSHSDVAKTLEITKVSRVFTFSHIMANSQESSTIIQLALKIQPICGILKRKTGRSRHPVRFRLCKFFETVLNSQRPWVTAGEILLLNVILIRSCSSSPPTRRRAVSRRCRGTPHQECGSSLFRLLP